MDHPVHAGQDEADHKGAQRRPQLGQRLVQRVALGELGDVDPSTSRVMMIANTPSVRARTRAGSCSRSMALADSSPSRTRPTATSGSSATANLPFAPKHAERLSWSHTARVSCCAVRTPHLGAQQANCPYFGCRGPAALANEAGADLDGPHPSPELVSLRLGAGAVVLTGPCHLRAIPSKTPPVRHGQRRPLLTA